MYLDLYTRIDKDFLKEITIRTLENPPQAYPFHEDDTLKIIIRKTLYTKKSFIYPCTISSINAGRIKIDIPKESINSDLLIGRYHYSVVVNDMTEILTGDLYIEQQHDENTNEQHTAFNNKKPIHDENGNTIHYDNTDILNIDNIDDLMVIEGSIILPSVNLND